MKKLIRFFAITLLISSFSQPLFAADKDANTNASTATTNTTTSTDATSSNTATTTATTTANTKKALSMSSLLQQLQKAGYIVRSAEYDKDDGQFKVDAVDRRGEKQNLDLNAAVGLSPDQKKAPRDVPLVQVVKKFEKNGSYVKSVSTDNNSYKVTVVDKQGNEQDVTIDPLTGKASQ